MSDIERDRAKARAAMRAVITARPATWTPDDLLDAMLDSGGVVWATSHRARLTGSFAGVVRERDTALADRVRLVAEVERLRLIAGAQGAEVDRLRGVLHERGGQS